MPSTVAIMTLLEVRSGGREDHWRHCSLIIVINIRGWEYGVRWTSTTYGSHAHPSTTTTDFSF